MEKESSSELWTDSELQSAIEAYIYCAQLQNAGVDYPLHRMTEALLAGPLKSRNEASIRYRMRNISYVMNERGWPTLAAYSPAPQVGAKVKARINAILDRYEEAELSYLKTDSQNHSLLVERTRTTRDLQEIALSETEDLEEALQELADEFVGIGHNRPPESIDEDLSLADDIQEARNLTRELKQELGEHNPDASSIEEKNNRLLDFGLRLATWLGARFTKFVDAALVAAGMGFGAKAMGIMPLIQDAVAAIARYIQSL